MINEAEIIALCEDPNEDFSDVQGRPPTDEEKALVAALAAAIFFKRPFHKQVEDILYFPTHVSARWLVQMATDDRNELLSHVPSDLAEEILAMMSVGADQGLHT